MTINLLPDDLVSAVFLRMSTTEKLQAALWTSRRLRQILLLTTEMLEFSLSRLSLNGDSLLSEWRLAATASHAGPWPALRELSLYGTCTDLSASCLGLRVASRLSLSLHFKDASLKMLSG